MSHQTFLASLRQDFPVSLDSARARHSTRRDPRWERTAEAIIILDQAGLRRREAVQVLRERGFDLPGSLQDPEAAERTGLVHLSRKVVKLRRFREQQQKEASA